MEEEMTLLLESQDGMEQTANTEIEDMPDFGEDTETQEPAGETEEETKAETEKKEDKSFYQWNPLQMAIKPFYDKAIAEDPLFAEEVRIKESREDKPKSLAECAEYILGEAYEYASKHRNGNFGLAGMPDEDMQGLIKHYYDEDDIVIRKVGANAKAKVVKTPDKPKADTKTNTVDLTKKFTKDKNGNEVKTEKDNAGNEVTTLKRNGQTFQITEYSLF